jgi:hypothetical protein
MEKNLSKNEKNKIIKGFKKSILTLLNSRALVIDEDRIDWDDWPDIGKSTWEGKTKWYLSDIHSRIALVQDAAEDRAYQLILGSAIFRVTDKGRKHILTKFKKQPPWFWGNILFPNDAIPKIKNNLATLYPSGSRADASDVEGRFPWIFRRQAIAVGAIKTTARNGEWTFFQFHEDEKLKLKGGWNMAIRKRFDRFPVMDREIGISIDDMLGEEGKNIPLSSICIEQHMAHDFPFLIFRQPDTLERGCNAKLMVYALSELRLTPINVTFEIHKTNIIVVHESTPVALVATARM